MSFLTSTRLGRVQFTIAIIGITGGLGTAIAPTFLTEYKPFFPTIIGTTRNSNSATAKALVAQGAEIREVLDGEEEEASFVEALQGVDVVIDATSVMAEKTKKALVQAIAKVGVPVYFPGEFGLDHRVDDFPGRDNKAWTSAVEHERFARELLGDRTKVICVYTAGFLEYIGPFLGFDTAHQKFTVIGPRTQRITLTSLSDVARSVAELSLLALSPTSSSTLPNHVRLAGSTHSVVEIKEIVERVRKERGVEDTKPFEIVEEDIDGIIARLKEQEKNGAEWFRTVVGYIRVTMGKDQTDFSTENANELVNPGGKIWKWKTLEDHVRAVGGKFGEQ